MAPGELCVSEPQTSAWSGIEVQEVRKRRVFLQRAVRAVAFLLLRQEGWGDAFYFNPGNRGGVLVSWEAITQYHKVCGVK